MKKGGERGRDQLRSLEVAKTGVAKSVADIFIPGLVLSSQCNFASDKCDIWNPAEQLWQDLRFGFSFSFKNFGTSGSRQ